MIDNIHEGFTKKELQELAGLSKGAFFTHWPKAEELGLEPHGTVGMLLKAYRQKIYSKKQSIEFIRGLKTKSTLYITTDIILGIIDEVTKKWA